MNPWIGMLALAMSLVLALRAFRSRGLPMRTKVMMALVWAVIILVAASMFNSFDR
jgi:hypothetical protein